MVIKETIYYSPAAEDRTLHIYLPDDYDSTDAHYPVMYFWDGHNLFFDSDATYGKSWGLKEFLDSWSPGLIIAGIECSHRGEHRLDEYCPYDAELFGNRITGEGRETMEWMTGVLKPYIDGHFRTLPSRETTAIGGSSMGGLMSLYAVTMYNDVYSRAACVSPTLMIVEYELRDELSSRSFDPDTRIYLSWGDRKARSAQSNDAQLHDEHGQLRAARANDVQTHDEHFRIMTAGSFMISADNAHAVHPNYPDRADPVNRPALNKGPVIKYNASLRYMTDAVSAAVFKELCRRAGVPCQEFTDRSDIVGGSTLGHQSMTHFSIPTADVGLPQLSMHSAYETAGTADTAYLIEVMRVFFSSSLRSEGRDCFTIE